MLCCRRIITGGLEKKHNINASLIVVGLRRASMPSPSGFLDVKLPAPQVDLEPPTQLPYVPDFWDSAKLAPEVTVTEVPKVIVVGGAETHHGGVPSHALEDVNVPVERDSSSQTATRRSESFLDDIAEDLRLPPIEEIKNSFRKLLS